MKEIKIKNKKLNRALKKMSIWPGAVLFIILLSAMMMILFSFVAIFLDYIGKEKVRGFKAEAEYIGHVLESEIFQKHTNIEEAIRYVSEYLKDENDICLIGPNYQITGKHGKSLPDLNKMDKNYARNDYELYADSVEDREYWEYEGLNIPILEVMKQTYNFSDYEEETVKWHEEILIDVTSWCRMPLQVEGYQVFYKGKLIIRRSDMIYVAMIALISIIILGIPLLLMLIYMVSIIFAQRRLRTLIYLDVITGGNNWMYFVNRCRFILNKARNARHGYALVNLHMDKYLDYCTLYSNTEGEKLLEKINNYLSVRIINKVETYARNEKGDFGLLIRCTSKEEAEEHLKKILAEITGIDKNRKLNFHVGYYILPPALTTQGLRKRKQVNIPELFQYASAARKSLGFLDKKHIAFCTEKLLQEQKWKHQVATTMQASLINGEFEMYLQPKYNPVTRKLEGAEALARWNNPERGLIMPDYFIPIFEENGFITQLDEYMISQVSKMLAEWKLKGRKLIPISVNLSRTLLGKHNLAEYICRLVDEYGTSHAYVELEITENAFFGNKKSLCQTVQELKFYGFPVSMDDFGSGYSSLNALKDLPIDTLKLDMEFFRGNDIEKRSAIVIKEAIQLAKNLSMKVVAEGIEKQEQVDFLSEHGCDMIQGYYFAKPMPVSEFEKLEESSVD